MSPERAEPAGILNVNKPAGITSHAVVARVRHMTGQRKAGHAGTLDPMATGVLLLCLGQATRVAEYLMAGRKKYRAVVRLGLATDTYDAEGVVTQAVENFHITQDQVPRGDLLDVPVPPHPDIGHGQFLQRRHGLLGAVFLGETEHGVQHHDDHNHHGVGGLAQNQRNHRRDDQDHHHDPGELLEQNGPRALDATLNQLVRPVFCQPAPGFLRG